MKKHVPLLLVAFLGLHIGKASAEINLPPEAKLIEVLKSDASYKAKSDACRALALNGTAAAVPTLAAMLPDPNVNHIARIALEQIPDPAVNAALLDALGKSQGLALVGVVSSLGARREVQAIAPLTKLLGADAEVANEAAISLGRIGTPASAKALMGALAKPTPAIYDGLLRCAESLPNKDAAMIYDALRKPPAPQPLQMTALRSAILARQEQGLPLLLDTLRGNDPALAVAAIQAARTVAGAGVTKALTAELAAGKLSADRQILLVQALGDRGDKVAGPQLLAVATKSEGDLRAAAVVSVIKIGDVSAIPLLTELATADDDEVAKSARAGLVGFAGKEVEAPIAAMLQSPNAKARLAATEIVVQRRMLGTMPQLLRGAGDADAAIATASLRAIGVIGSSAEAPALIKILTSGASMQAAENALTAIYALNRDASAADTLSAALPAAPKDAKLSLLRVLRRVGGPKALVTMRAAMADTNPEIRENAIRNLSDWQTPDAVPDLLQVATTPPNPALKILALRGILRLIPQQEGTADQKLTSVKSALALVERPEEKRLALAALGTIQTADSLALVLQDLANPALKEEASQAAVAIGEELVKTQPAVVAEAMKQVIAAAPDQQLVKRAQSLMPK